MTGPDGAGIQLWDVTPRLIDLLGFDAVVQPILEAVSSTDTVTIGVQSPWGDHVTLSCFPRPGQRSK